MEKENRKNLPANLISDEELETKNESAKKSEDEDIERYDELFDITHPGSRIFSFCGVIASLIALVLSYFGWPAIILGVISITLSIFSRKKLRYFDTLGILSLVMGIFAVVLGIGLTVLRYGPFAEELLRLGNKSFYL